MCHATATYAIAMHTKRLARMRSPMQHARLGVLRHVWFDAASWFETVGRISTNFERQVCVIAHRSLRRHDTGKLVRDARLSASRLSGRADCGLVWIEVCTLTLVETALFLASFSANNRNKISRRRSGGSCHNRKQKQWNSASKLSNKNCTNEG